MTYCFGGQFICHEFIVTDSSRSFHFHIHFCQSQHCIIGLPKVLLCMMYNIVIRCTEIQIHAAYSSAKVVSNWSASSRILDTKPYRSASLPHWFASIWVLQDKTTNFFADLSTSKITHKNKKDCRSLPFKDIFGIGLSTIHKLLKVVWSCPWCVEVGILRQREFR